MEPNISLLCYSWRIMAMLYLDTGKEATLNTVTNINLRRE